MAAKTNLPAKRSDYKATPLETLAALAKKCHLKWYFLWLIFAELCCFLKCSGSETELLMKKKEKIIPAFQLGKKTPVSNLPDF